MMNQTNKIRSLSEYANQHIHTVVVSKDLWLGSCLGDYLFKLCGTDEVIWIPEDAIRQATFNDHAFEITLHEDDVLGCAKMTISNSIRLWLIDHHQITGQQALPYLKRS